MLRTKITEIGQYADSKEDGLMIMFNDTASAKLRDVSLIHELVPDFDQKYDLAVGQKVYFDQQAYEITFIGELVESNLMSIGHTILDFHAVPAVPRSNAIYLRPQGEPDVHVGTIVTFGGK
ncbi:glucitol/sorbitol-specific PTS system IIA component [Ligilactobacillus salitolerans]|uniref:Glucitol/sorbitol-specific PTS system IIA component n=1 Tax=Ligilactobacillus salitolerans TaxID=1808352 RepID=A0A401ISV7_9LACO|nr:PTS glucitol/sorbitol transporter subunit IIA [Ligilactobacillus salitolerans]GBG94606.1 glucitol/sorbitol-specific PTS system IIA component [Ligilactobacillus salitolerans]